MKCPIDQTDLAISTREGVEIDYCPKCRGVWLDRGELDKLIDRSERAYASGASGREEVEPRAYRNDDDRDYDDDYRDDRGSTRPGRKKKKRESFLEDLFDFG